MKTVDPSSTSSHYVLIDSLSVLLRRHGLSAITELLDALPGAQLPGENLLKAIVMLQYFLSISFVLTAVRGHPLQ